MRTVDELLHELNQIQAEVAVCEDKIVLFHYKSRVDNIVMLNVIGSGISDQSNNLVNLGIEIKKEIASIISKMSEGDEEVKCPFQEPPKMVKDKNITAFDRVMKEFDLIEQIFKAQLYRIGDKNQFPFVMGEQVPGLIEGRYFVNNFILADLVFLDIHSLKKEFSKRCERALNFDIISEEIRNIIERAEKLLAFYDAKMTINNEVISNFFKKVAQINTKYKELLDLSSIQHSAVTTIKEYKITNIFLEANMRNASEFKDISIYTSRTLVFQNTQLENYCRQVIEYLNNLPFSFITKPDPLQNIIVDQGRFKNIFDSLILKKQIVNNTQFADFLFTFNAGNFPLNWQPIKWSGSRKACFSFMMDMCGDEIKPQDINNYFTQYRKNIKSGEINTKPLTYQDRSGCKRGFLETIKSKS